MRLSTLSESEIIITLIALALLLLSAFVFGTLMELIKGPRVVGEIIGGMVIGGSFLFIIAPALSERIFFAYPEEGKVLNIYSFFRIIQRALHRWYRERTRILPCFCDRSCDHHERTRRSGDRSCDRGLLI